MLNIETQTFSRGKILTELLQISDNLGNLLLYQLKDKSFKSSQIKLDRSGSFAITLEYHLTEDIVSKYGGKRTIASSCHQQVHSPSPTISKRKMKTTSRRRRDREQFLERKKQRKRAAVLSDCDTNQESDKSQLSAVSISSQTPPSKSIDSPIPSEIVKEVEEVLLAPPAEDYFGPYLEQHYDTCDCMKGQKGNI